MESVNSAEINNNISFNVEEIHCPSEIIEMAKRIDIASKEHLFQVTEEVGFDFNNFDEFAKKEIANIENNLVIEENNLVIREVGNTEKQNSVSLEVTTIEKIAFHEEILKNFIMFNAATPEQAKIAIDNGNFENITKVDNHDLNLANRAYLDHDKREIIVPIGSLLKSGSEHKINGITYTVRHETKDERVSFENNWSSYKAALKNYEIETNKSKQNIESQKKPTNTEDNNQEGLDQKQRLTKKQLLEDGILSRETNIGVMKYINKKHDIEKKWLFEEITKEDLSKEFGKKNLSKESINLEMIRQVIIVSSSPFVLILNISESNSSVNGHSVRVISLRATHLKNFRVF